MLVGEAAQSGPVGDQVLSSRAGQVFARAEGQVIAVVLFQQSDPKARPKKSIYGLLAAYGPSPSAEEIDENSQDMFRDFAEDAP